jgi:hypothetical protein
VFDDLPSDVERRLSARRGSSLVKVAVLVRHLLKLKFQVSNP